VGVAADMGRFASSVVAPSGQVSRLVLGKDYFGALAVTLSVRAGDSVVEGTGFFASSVAAALTEVVLTVLCLVVTCARGGTVAVGMRHALEVVQVEDMRETNRRGKQLPFHWLSVSFLMKLRQCSDFNDYRC
jgi:hypothetical protein